MPKVISRSIAVTDNQDDASYRQPRMHVYYCLCSNMVLIIDKKIDQLPMRKTDQARFLEKGKHGFKLKAEFDQTVCIRRPGGKERQHRMKCGQCGLLLCYKIDKHAEDVFLVNGSFLLEGETPNMVAFGLQTAIRMEGTDTGAKHAGYTVATSTLEEEQELEMRELGANYNANAAVINLLTKRSDPKRKATEQAEPENRRKRKGTLLTD